MSEDSGVIRDASVQIKSFAWRHVKARHSVGCHTRSTTRNEISGPCCAVYCARYLAILKSNIDEKVGSLIQCESECSMSHNFMMASLLSTSVL